MRQDGRGDSRVVGVAAILDRQAVSARRQCGQGQACHAVGECCRAQGCGAVEESNDAGRRDRAGQVCGKYQCGARCHIALGTGETDAGGCQRGGGHGDADGLGGDAGHVVGVAAVTSLEGSGACRQAVGDQCG